MNRPRPDCGVCVVTYCLSIYCWLPIDLGSPCCKFSISTVILVLMVVSVFFFLIYAIKKNHSDMKCKDCKRKIKRTSTKQQNFEGQTPEEISEITPSGVLLLGATNAEQLFTET